MGDGGNEIKWIVQLRRFDADDELVSAFPLMAGCALARKLHQRQPIFQLIILFRVKFCLDSPRVNIHVTANPSNQFLHPVLIIRKRIREKLFGGQHNFEIAKRVVTKFINQSQERFSEPVFIFNTDGTFWSEPVHISMIRNSTAPTT